MNRKNYLILFTSLYLGFSFYFRSIASDNLSFKDIKEEINSSLKIMAPKMPALLYQKYRDKIEEARLKLNFIDFDQTKNFISTCRDNHRWITKFYKDDTDFDFFESEAYLIDYLKGHWTTNENLEMTWLCYYLKGAKFYYNQQLWLEAENFFIKAAQLSPEFIKDRLQRIYLGVLFGFKETYDASKKNPKPKILLPDVANISEKLFTIYTNYHKSLTPSLEYDSIDISFLALSSYKANQYETSNNFILKLLEYSPEEFNKSHNLFKPTHDALKRVLAENMMHLEKFAEAKKYYLQCNSQDFNSYHYLDLSLIYALEKNWSQSFYYFKMKYDGTGPNFHIPSLNEQDAYFNEKNITLFFTMITQQQQKKFNAYTKYFVKDLSKAFPHVLDEMASQQKDFEKKHQTEVKNITLHAMALKRFETIKENYNLFFQEYLTLWSHCSALSSEDRIVILDSMDDLVTLIKDNYHHLKALEAQKAYVENITEITNLSLLLTDNFKNFSNQVKEKKQKIFRIQRQIHKASSTNIDDEASTYSGISNLKSQFLSEQTSVKEKAKEKEDLSKGTQQKLPEQRKQLKNEDEKNNYPQNSERGMLRFFKNDVTKRLWDTQEVNHYPQKALEMLSALNAAQDMIHLRSLLTPGTILKILKGDRQGQLSLRINDQYRLCFNWITGEGAFDIEIVDYHR